MKRKAKTCTWLLVPPEYGAHTDASWKTWCGEWFGLESGVTPEPDADFPGQVFRCGFNFCPMCGGKLNFMLQRPAAAESPT
jgi:hypothetical protein